MNETLEKVNLYHAINDIALKGEVVVFGSDFMADFPFYELSQKYVFSAALYNRSIRGLTLAEGEQALKDCVLDIKPSKIFFALGENDLQNPSALVHYRRILDRTHKELPHADLYLLPVPGTSAAAQQFNLKLHQLCQEEKVDFLPVNYDMCSGHPQYGKIFKKLSAFFRTGRIGFAEAFALAN